MRTAVRKKRLLENIFVTILFILKLSTISGKQLKEKGNQRPEQREEGRLNR
jgi:hypothetical protein